MSAARTTNQLPAPAESTCLATRRRAGRTRLMLAKPSNGAQRAGFRQTARQMPRVNETDCARVYRPAVLFAAMRRASFFRIRAGTQNNFPFQRISLARVFLAAGFYVSELTEEFEGQYLAVYAQPNGEKVPEYDDEMSVEVGKIAREIASFTADYKSKMEACARNLERVREKGQRAVIWGAGSKGVAFLNAFKDSGIEYAVDLNPCHQGLYIPGSGQQIVPPEFLKGYKPDVIMVMNPTYRSEIQQTAKSQGLTTKFVNAC
jgi:hypothetical protein